MTTPSTRFASAFATTLMCLSGTIAGQETLPPPEATEVWAPSPPVVESGLGSRIPSDAIALFDGTDLSEWRGRDGTPSWTVQDGAMTVKPGTGSLTTKRAFSDVQLHLEWRTPRKIIAESQGRGNSGVFLMGLYEVQVLDSWENPTYVNGQAASIYKQHVPLVNASRRPGAWQTYDIIFTGPRFDTAGALELPATLTVLHNGILVQHHVTLEGPTVFRGRPHYEPHAEKLPIMLQDHRNLVSFRNIWIREL